MKWREEIGRGGEARPVAHVRPLRAADLALLPTMHALCVRQGLASHYTPQHIAAWIQAHDDQHFSDAIEAGEHYLIAEMQGALAGYASWRAGELRSTFVAPAAQEMGVGTLLVDNCAFDARAAGTPIRQVCATLNAIGFYRALGFQTTEPGFHEEGGVRLPYQMMVRPAG